MATEKFHYTTEAGVEIVLPKFRNIPAGVIRKLRNESNLGFIFGILEAVGDEDANEAIDAMDMAEMGRFSDAWQKDGKVTSGESSASSNS